MDGGDSNGNVNHHLVTTSSCITRVSEDDIVKLNVCGFVYETLESTLRKFPSTLLGNPEKRAMYYLPTRKQYFFDKNRTTFEAILYFYQTNGHLVRPPSIPMKFFAEDVKFFELGDNVLHHLQVSEGFISEAARVLPKNEYQRRVWELFEYPDTSPLARILAIWSICVIMVSIVVFCIETLPTFRHKAEEQVGKQEQPWFTLEIVSIAWFTLEYIARLLSAPNQWKFFISFLNLIDLTAILPYYITLPMDSTNATPLSVLRVLRLVRVFRIFKLSRHSVGLRILGHTLKESSRELAMLMFFLALGIVLFSSAVFYAEVDVNEKDFSSIPDTFWYCLVTMTTVGYGDKVPKTMLGKMIGSLCAIVGVLTIALPVPVIVSNFEFFYKRDRLLYCEPIVETEQFSITGCDGTHSGENSGKRFHQRQPLMHETNI